MQTLGLIRPHYIDSKSLIALYLLLCLYLYIASERTSKVQLQSSGKYI